MLYLTVTKRRKTFKVINYCHIRLYKKCGVKPLLFANAIGVAHSINFVTLYPSRLFDCHY